MKKQYIAAMACLMAGAIGFLGIYSWESNRSNKENVARQEKIVDTEIKITETAKVVKPIPKKVELPKVEKYETKPPKEEKKQEEKKPAKETSVEVKALHFSADEKSIWPIKGKVILPYSMDATVYFPTLDQYQHNPAMIIAGNVNDKVFFIADGKITKVYNNEETGCTVEQDLGDGYTAIYGQLRDLPFKKGAQVEGGQVVGYVAEPTKYYSTEGSNVYFSLRKDGVPVNPGDYIKAD